MHGAWGIVRLKIVSTYCSNLNCFECIFTFLFERSTTEYKSIVVFRGTIYQVSSGVCPNTTLASIETTPPGPLCDHTTHSCSMCVSDLLL